MKNMSVTYSAEGIITKVKPVRFCEIEGKTVKEAIAFVNDPSNTERFKEMVDFFNERIMQIKESCITYGVELGS